MDFDKLPDLCYDMGVILFTQFTEFHTVLVSVQKRLCIKKCLILRKYLHEAKNKILRHSPFDRVGIFVARHFIHT